MSPTVPIIYKWGVIKSASDDTVAIASLGEQLTASMPNNATLYTMPAVGDVWKFHATGSGYELDEKLDLQSVDIKSIMLPSDVLLKSNTILYIRAARIDMEDSFGPMFDPVTGKLNPARLPSND